mgnify:CR=1 FL=1|tara:strand:+ start:363 stop:509 length:147 start_codon:yes stop_codon:yes gene_type:complete
MVNKRLQKYKLLTKNYAPVDAMKVYREHKQAFEPCGRFIGIIIIIGRF